MEILGLTDLETLPRITRDFDCWRRNLLANLIYVRTVRTVVSISEDPKRGNKISGSGRTGVVRGTRR